MKVKPIFAWYDLWIGVFIDRPKRPWTLREWCARHEWAVTTEAECNGYPPPTEGKSQSLQKGTIHMDIEAVTADLNNRFNYHQPSSQEVVDKHQQVREGCHYAANVVATACPEGREKSLALTKLEEAMMWANAAIARSQ